MAFRLSTQALPDMLGESATAAKFERLTCRRAWCEGSRRWSTLSRPSWEEVQGEAGRGMAETR